MIKNKAFHLVSLLVLAGCSSFANTAGEQKNLDASADVAGTAQTVAQQAEAIRLEQERLQQEAQKLAEAEAKIDQTLGANQLLLKDTTAKIYAANQFNPMWQDKKAEKAFLREYALLAASGASLQSAKALNQILQQPEGLARDILLTDSFLDYLYYSQNALKYADNWLYDLGSYKTKAPSENLIANWGKAVTNGEAAQFVANLVPKNHIYQQTTEKLFAMSPNAVVSTGSKKAKKAQDVESASFQKLALNAQRLRIISSFNNGIFVNIPSYQLYYFRDGQLALQSKVIVGREERRTPVMYSKLSNVVVNPPWTVPPTILNKDLIPKLAKDPGYADRAGFEILDHKGNKISPHSVKWSSYTSNNFPYVLRQKAGDDSALGRYKFNMPSSSAIFLHDTPSRNLFAKTDRAISSGCVRVAKADELATILLQEAGWSLDRKKNVLASKKTTSAQIRSDNPVYLYYVTAWVENGKVYTLPDIYKYDVKLPATNLNWDAVKKAL